ncbi:MAG TPA: hypothetical protein VFU43_22885 [Streptosporangiaceae bacterium]|nr:hypothetical protein [Streptosporangiaceae bacterium]
MAEPRRVVVTGPRSRGVPAPRYSPVTRDIDEQTELGAVYVRSLMRVQLRHSLATCAIVAIVVGVLPLVFVLAPGLSAIKALGVPLPWLVLGLGVQPLWIGAAARYVRRAERTERDFTDLVARS